MRRCCAGSRASTRAHEHAHAVAVPTSLPANDIKEFIELARKSPTPLAYGSGGAGGISHLPMA
ncbi:hypothetical protein IB278_33290, partial [Variovorax sp. VRV01]|nr:hypothetical protein [Variovorax sp. VRV01]